MLTIEKMRELIPGLEDYIDDPDSVLTPYLAIGEESAVSMGANATEPSAMDVLIMARIAVMECSFSMHSGANPDDKQFAAWREHAKNHYKNHSPGAAVVAPPRVEIVHEKTQL